MSESVAPAIPPARRSAPSSRYNASKSLGRAISGGLQVLFQAVASKLIIDPIDGAVTGI
jgi:hypothetical protein